MSSEIILASSSIYRKNLLLQLQVDFRVVLPTVEERDYHDDDPAQLARLLSVLKAQSVPLQRPALVIGADQVAVLDNTMMPKPITEEIAIAQLRAVSGKTVHFHSGIALYNSITQKTQVTSVLTIVEFRHLTETMIMNYLQKESVLNCGCSLKSEGLGITLLKKMQATDPTALIGLPLMTLCDFLVNEGVEMP